jgi:purine nucleoside permease
MRVRVYNKQLNNQDTGVSAINPRVAIGALNLKPILNIEDQEVAALLKKRYAKASVNSCRRFIGI